MYFKILSYSELVKSTTFSFFLHLQQPPNRLPPLSRSPSVFTSLGSTWLGRNFYSKLHRSLPEIPHLNLQLEWISFSSSNALCWQKCRFCCLEHRPPPPPSLCSIILANCHLSCRSLLTCHLWNLSWSPDPGEQFNCISSFLCRDTYRLHRTLWSHDWWLFSQA